jgi:hypothetical protein
MTLMRNPYGYFVGVLANDGDQLDVYVGPDRYSDRVFIVKQMKAPGFNTYDEIKVMLAFTTAQDAKTAYLKQYNDPRFFGEMTEMPFNAFKASLEKRIESKGVLSIAELKAAALRAGGKTLKKSGEEMCKQIGDGLGVDWKEVDFDEFCGGMFVEEDEHKDVTGGDPKKTALIVLAHLKEDPHYYTKLAKIEKAISRLYIWRKK